MLLCPTELVQCTSLYIHVRIHFKYGNSLTSGVDTKGTSGGAGRATVTLLKENNGYWLPLRNVTCAQQPTLFITGTGKHC